MFTPAVTYLRSVVGYGLTGDEHIIAYTRVSTQKQGVSGLWAQAQRDAIARFAKAEGCLIAGAFTGAPETGKGAERLDRRPQLAAAIKAARKLGVPVVVSKLDRLSRDVDSISGLMAHKVPLIINLGADTDPFMFRHLRRPGRERAAAY